MADLNGLDGVEVQLLSRVPTAVHSYLLTEVRSYLRPGLGVRFPEALLSRASKLCQYRFIRAAFLGLEPLPLVPPHVPDCSTRRPFPDGLRPARKSSSWS